MTLTDFVTLFPTPTAATYGTRNNGKRGDGTTFKTAGAPSLETMARHGLWPTFATPTARDWRSGKASEATMEKNARPLSEQVGGQLNPTWVEWLMGYPTGWTACEPWATASYRPARVKRSADSPASKKRKPRRACSAAEHEETSE